MHRREEYRVTVLFRCSLLPALFEYKSYIDSLTARNTDGLTGKRLDDFVPRKSDPALLMTD